MAQQLQSGSSTRAAGSGVLRTRLLPPRLPPGCLPRPELVARVLEGLRGRLVALEAGAGYGKSTLLAQALERVGAPWVWLSCDERLGGARPLLAHLAAGLADRFPGVGARLALEGSVEDGAAELCNEVLATVGDEFVLALDDVHTLAGRPAGEALGLLTRDLPPNVHLAMAARGALPFALGRLRAGRVVELGEEALALSAEESVELLRAARPDLGKDAAAELHRRTEGWMAGLLLAARSGVAASPGGFARHGDRAFDYLAEEVFAQQPPELRDFLLDTAVLERFTPELAAALSGRGRDDARSLITRLVSGHLFVVRLAEDDDWFRYHHLFQAFLRRRLEEGDRDRLRTLHRRAAEAWAEAGETAEAVGHHLQAGDHERAVELLEPIAEGMVHTPDSEGLAAWLQELPPALWSERPGLVLAHASLLFTRAEHEASFAGLERAIETLIARGEHERAAVAVFRLLLSMVVSGAGPARRLEAGRRFLPRLEPGTSMLPAARIMLALSFGFGCHYAEAEDELSAALALPAAAGNPILQVYADVVRAFYIGYPQGRGDEAILAFDGAIRHLESADADPLAFLVYTRAARAYVLNDLGRHEDALAEVDRFEEAAQWRSMPRTTARMREWHRATALAGLERWDELERELVPAAYASAPGEVTHYAYRHRAPAALLAGQHGDAPAVSLHVEAARAAMTAHGPAFDLCWILCDLALAARAARLQALARELAGEAREGGAALGMPWGRARAALIGALVARDEAEGDRLLGEALELTVRHGFVGLWARRERPRAGPLLARALDRGIGGAGPVARVAVDCGGEVAAEVADLVRSPRVRALLAEAAGETGTYDAALVRRLGADPDAGVRRAARWARARVEASPRAPIRITSFGGFSVARAGTPVPPLATGRQRARTLLAVLLCADGAVHRELLIEWLWPHLPPARGLASLHTALHALRGWLEPGLPRASESSLLVTEGDAYRLVLGDGDGWDAGQFLALARGPLTVESSDERRERLLAAEGSHAGEFLPEWRYEDWAAPRRAEIEGVQREVLRGLAEALEAAGQHDAAAARYERLVALEPERERWHRALMSAYARAGERALALRQFHACRRVLDDRLGVEPSAETRELYRALL